MVSPVHQYLHLFTCSPVHLFTITCHQIGAKSVMPEVLLDWVKDGEQETVPHPSPHNGFSAPPPCHPPPATPHPQVLAVLPFFHIYSMELIMLLNMRLGNKIITLPKFEPEMYLKALVCKDFNPHLS